MNEYDTNKPIKEMSAFELILHQAEKGNRVLAEGLFDELDENEKNRLRHWIVQIYTIGNDWPEETLRAIKWLSNIAELWYLMNYYSN